ncbi:hypothetical protein LOD99_5978 [Oopsacas minuta]|uniref:Uncharacterized protein n=1 Tax=Oopsacas minuta TaxID=111878 RepID=A0AAV7JPL9_9METZ|nr:hypothetical protein LOD99_5978 [Oopsacas minuta]
MLTVSFLFLVTLSGLSAAILTLSPSHSYEGTLTTTIITPYFNTTSNTTYDITTSYVTNNAYWHYSNTNGRAIVVRGGEEVQDGVKTVIRRIYSHQDDRTIFHLHNDTCTTQSSNLDDDSLKLILDPWWWLEFANETSPGTYELFYPSSVYNFTFYLEVCLRRPLIYRITLEEDEIYVLREFDLTYYIDGEPDVELFKISDQCTEEHAACSQCMSSAIGLESNLVMTVLILLVLLLTSF